MGDEKRTPIERSPSKWQKFARKRWVFPAMYLGLAAIVLTTVLWMQGGDDQAQDLTEMNSDRSAYDDNEKAIPVSNANEVFSVPADGDVYVTKQFYDTEASAEEQEAALVFYNNTYYQNSGLDYALKNGESFDVVAAMSGKVVKATEDALLGNVVHIEHEDGVTTVYESLGELSVSEGDAVKQGEKLGTAGENKFNADAGTHLHFEVRKEGQPVNPLDVLNQPLSSVKAKEQASDEEVQAEQDAEQKTNVDQGTDGQEVDQDTEDQETVDPAEELETVDPAGDQEPVDQQETE
ncbi:M23 family metallopeptidase [Pseudalkalibacillus caeni]|nr:M23 family metallopeptidase [Pseudalkalibacillus caeni]